MELTLLFILLIITFLFLVKHIGKLILKFIAWILMQSILKNVNKRNEEHKLQDIKNLKNMGIKILSEEELRRSNSSYTAIR